ncbi:26260_t:CDS:1, partial [Racocetra persica]
KQAVDLNRLEAGSSGAGRRKRDNLNNLGGTISIEELSFDEALYDIRNNLNQSAMDITEFANQFDSIVPSINSKLRDTIATKLNGSDITILNNFISPKLDDPDYGRSAVSQKIDDFLTARIISSVMTAYGAVICNNDVQYQCQQYQCSCNTPIGKNNSIIAGGFGPNNDGRYGGYRDNHIALISKWRNVSDFGDNFFGWAFNNDSCDGYERQNCGNNGGSGGGKNNDKRSTKYLICEAKEC